jgi:hypothetical protein
MIRIAILLLLQERRKLEKEGRELPPKEVL